MPKLFQIDLADIKSIWPGFQFRSEQNEMANFIHDGFLNKRINLIEAGTGIGKTLSYLLPLLEYLKNSQGRIAISTQTKALQEQIISQDLPMAQKIYGTDFESEICMGSGNYLCKRKLTEVLSEGKASPAMINSMDEFLNLEKKSIHGMHSDFKQIMEADFWKSINRDKDECLARRCQNYKESYYFLAKERWKNSRILILNHSLLASHYAFNEMLLPDIDCFVIDEAHSFADTFHRSFTNQSSWMELMRLAYSLGQGYGKLLKTLESFRIQIVQAGNIGFETRVRITDKIEIPVLQALIKEIVSAQASQNELLEQSKSQMDLGFGEDGNYQKNIIEMKIKSRINQLQTHRHVLESYIRIPEKSDVHWLEFRYNSEINGFYPVFNHSPIESGEVVFNNFLSINPGVLFTSATLCTTKQNPFNYTAMNLGLTRQNSNFSTLQLKSPFDYQSRALLYLAPNMPDPVSGGFQAEEKKITEMSELITLSKGGAFILFTSKKSLQESEKILKQKLPQVNFISQLDPGGAMGALSRFRNDANAVLLGLATFWQGVDVLGDQLRLVIIVRLPFRVPDEPLLAARMQSLKEKGINPFMEIQLPQAIISLKQGFGRLIRSENDRGIVAILDPRIKTRRYGPVILNSLPEAKIINDFKLLRVEYQKLFV